MSDGKRRKSEPVIFRVTPEFKGAVLRAARAESRPIGLFIEKILRDYLLIRGIDPDAPAEPAAPS